MADVATYAENLSPDTGGTITVNGTSYGGYDYRIADSANLPTPNVLSSFTASDWFTNTTNPNERVALVVFKGNVTMSSIIFEPNNSTNNAKSFTVIYVDGNLTLSSSTVSMTRRGGENPSYTSLPLTAAPHTTRTLTGTAGKGGNGGRSAYPGQTSWAGKVGGLFSGGGGGSGGLNTGTNTITITGQSNAEPRGGRGGGSVTTFNGWNIGGGGGNPPGVGVKQNGSGSANNGVQGAGGTIIIIVNGTFTGTGSNITAQGAAGGSAVQSSGGQAAAGGGSGGGRVRVLAKTLASLASTTVTGGAGGGGTRSGSAGGNGNASQVTY
jgi:hypothetical protein